MSNTGRGAVSFLNDAIGTLSARATSRDAGSTGERSMAKTVAIFNAWTGEDMSEADGWRFMLCLKQAREIQGKFHADDYVDLAGYASLLGEHCSPTESSRQQFTTTTTQKVLNDQPSP